MATSKLLKPTNVTISIPEFTDQPDQRVNSNCLDKEADAINALSEQIGKHSFGTAVTLTYNTAYTTTADGYVVDELGGNTTDSSAIMVNNVYVAFAININTVLTVYVKKGMTVKIAGDNHSQSAKFYPLT